MRMIPDSKNSGIRFRSVTRKFYAALVLVAAFMPGQSGYAQSFKDYIRDFKKKEIPQAMDKFARTNIYKSKKEVALARCDSLISFALENKNNELLSVGYRIKGIYYSNILREFDEAYAYFERSLDAAKKAKSQIQEAKALFQRGYAFYQNDDLAHSLESFLPADQIMQKLGYENIYDISRHQYVFGVMLASFFNIEKSNSYLNGALEDGSDSEIVMAAYNQLGTNYKMQGEYDIALSNCLKSLEYAESLNDSLRIAIISGNIGDIYMELDSLEQSGFFLNRAERLCLKYNDLEHAHVASVFLAELAMKRNLLDEVKDRLHEVGLFIEQGGLRRKKETKEQYYRLLSELYKGEGEYTLATEAMDSIIKLRERYNPAEIANMLRNIETSIQVEKFNSDLAMSESIRKRQKLFFTAGILISLLVILVLYLSYTKKLEKRKQNLRVLELSKQNMESKLEHARHRLGDFVQSLKEKNALIEELKLELEEISVKNLLTDSEKQDVIYKMRQTTILTEKDWNDFKVAFEKVYVHFFRDLTNEYPDLTVSELRVLSLIKLNLSADEMGTMLGVSPESVKRTFRRIRTKIKLPNQIALENLVAETT